MVRCGTTEPMSSRKSLSDTMVARRMQRRKQQGLPPLPLGVRLLLFVVGWSLLLLGVAGLFLPFLQGLLMILAGAAVLSLVSELAYKGLRQLMRPRPWTWRRFLRLRRRIHRFFSRGHEAR